MISAVVLICLYVVVLFPDFFSTQNPEQTDARQAFIPVQMLHFFDDGWNPWVPAIAVGVGVFLDGLIALGVLSGHGH